MEAVAFEQAMDRLCEEGFLDVEVHVQPVEVRDPETEELIGYRGERVIKKGMLVNKTLKKIYTVAKDKEINLYSAGGVEPVEEGEKIELVATTYDMRNTCFFVVRPQYRKRSSIRRVALQFRGFKRISSRDFVKH